MTNINGWNCVQCTWDTLQRLAKVGEALGEKSVFQCEVVNNQFMSFV